MLTFRVISDLQQKVNDFLFMSIVTFMDLASSFQKYPKFPGKRGRWMLDQFVQHKIPVICLFSTQLFER